MYRRITVVVIALLASLPSLDAQKLAVSTDLMGYADLGTLNAEVSMSLSRHWTANAGVRYNPFMFKGGEDNHYISNRQRAFSAGGRYWFWHVYSGWWFAGKMQYQEYNRGGLRSPETREGDRVGAGLAAGFTYMLSSHFNFEVSAGAWGGYDTFNVYECPVCGLTKDTGSDFFILPNDITISISYLF